MKKKREWFFLHYKKNQKIYKVMKLTTLILLIGTMQLSATIYSQKQRIVINEKNISLADLFWKIQEKTDFVFAFSVEDVKEYNNLTINERGNIKKVLTNILKDKGLTFKLVKGVYVIQQQIRSNSSLELKNKVSQQVITGQVADENGDPLPGVSVFFKETPQIGTITNLNGHYEIDKTLEEQKTLVFSYIGYDKQEILIEGKTSIDVSLIEATMVEEVVVTGYQTISKERATGSFGKINSEDLASILNTSVAEQLEGRVQGLLVHNGKITIRGTNTFEANKEPLLVVDNLPLNSVKELDYINPDDIDNFVVLKDAAAASIYGVRAANGVIVITTKSGGTKKGDYFDVEFSAQYTISDKVNISDLNFASAADIIDFEKEAILNHNWADYTSEQYDFTNMTFTANPYSRAQEIILNAQRNAATPGTLADSELAAMNSELNALSGNALLNEVDKYMFQNQVKQRYNLSVIGNSNNANYRFSVLYEKDRGQRVGVNSDKIGISSKTNLKLSSKSKLNINFIGNYDNSRNNSFSSRLEGIKPYERIKDENGDKVPVYDFVPQHHKDHYTTNPEFQNWDNYFLDELNDRDRKDNSLYVRLNVGYDYEILEGLSFNSQLMGSASVQNSEDLRKADSFHSRDFYNRFTVEKTDPFGGTFYDHLYPKGGDLLLTESKNKSWSFRNQFLFDREFTENHRINVLVGVELISEITELSTEQKLGYDPQSLIYETAFNWGVFSDITTRNYAGGTNALAPNSSIHYNNDRYISFYGNASYHYQRKYSVSVSARRDESNLFGATPDYKKNLLWSAGLAWNIHNEDFLKSELLNRLSLRATYGINGNVDKNTSPFLTISSSNNFFLGRNFNFITNPPNKFLRWERTKVINIGVDFAIMNNRIGGSVEFYNKESVDLLGIKKLDYTYGGFGFAKVNTASMYNRGVDVNLNFVPISTNDFNWDVNFNFSYNYNEVTSVELTENSTTSYLNSNNPVEGKPLNHLHTWKWAGLSNTGLAQVYDANGQVVDFNTTVSDPDALDFVGVTVPKYYGGLQQYFSYKNWSTSINFSYGLGHKMRLAGAGYDDAWYGNSDKIIANRWREPGDESTTNIPGIPSNLEDVTTYRKGLYEKSSINVVDASYIQLRNINLSYNIGKTPYFKNIELMVQINNIWMWTANNQGVDPLVGINNFSIPRSYTFAIRGRF